MDPMHHRLDRSPRSLAADAFFSADRSTTGTTQTVNQIEVQDQGAKEAFLGYETQVVRGQRDCPGVAPVLASLPGFKNKNALKVLTVPNPLPHARKTAKDGGIDPAVARWTHNATYTCFFSSAARALSATAPDQPRLQVKLLFGTGSEAYRHGVAGAVEGAAQPTLLIVISGIEPEHTIEFTNPGNPADKQRLLANNRWGVGITTASIEQAIRDRYGRVISYDISVIAAFSTGYLGLQESINRTLFPLGGLERVIIFDCLYGTLKTALDRVKALKGSVQIIAYVVTGGGNSFQKDQAPSLATLALGGNRQWNYIDLMGNVGFHAVTSARLVSEGRSATARILDPLPAAYETALNGLVARLPGRNTVVSSEAVMRKVRGSLPGGTTVLATFAADKANAAAIQTFFREVNTTRRCIGRAQLLGWPAPPGEEWHDMLLIEFAWEYLA